jgi:hypothetical protein
LTLWSANQDFRALSRQACGVLPFNFSFLFVDFNSDMDFERATWNAQRATV